MIITNYELGNTNYDVPTDAFVCSSVVLFVRACPYEGRDVFVVKEK